MLRFHDIDVETRKRVLKRVGSKLVSRFGAVPESQEEFAQKFSEMSLDREVIEILRKEYDKTGFTVTYTIEDVYSFYDAMMR